MSDLVVTMQKTDLETLIIDCVRGCLDDHQPVKEPFSEYPEFLTRNQACEILNISLGTLDGWTRQGRITKHRSGKIVRYRKAELLQSMKTLQKFERYDSRLGN